MGPTNSAISDQYVAIQVRVGPVHCARDPLAGLSPTWNQFQLKKLKNKKTQNVKEKNAMWISPVISSQIAELSYKLYPINCTGPTGRFVAHMKPISTKKIKK